MGHPRLTRVRAKAKSRSKAAGGGFLPSLTGLGSPFSGLPRTYVLDYCLPPLRGWFRISSFYPRLARGLHSAAASRLGLVKAPYAALKRRSSTVVSACGMPEGMP
jgi:hypothetical protein